MGDVVFVEEHRPQRRRRGQGDGHAAETRHGCGVNLPVAVGVVQDAEPPAQPDGQGREHQAGGGGNGEKSQVGSHDASRIEEPGGYGSASVEG